VPTGNIQEFEVAVGGLKRSVEITIADLPFAVLRAADTEAMAIAANTIAIAANGVCTFVGFTPTAANGAARVDNVIELAGGDRYTITAVANDGTVTVTRPTGGAVAAEGGYRIERREDYVDMRGFYVTAQDDGDVAFRCAVFEAGDDDFTQTLATGEHLAFAGIPQGASIVRAHSPTTITKFIASQML